MREVDVTDLSAEQIKALTDAGAYVMIPDRPIRTSCATCDMIIFSKSGNTTPEECPWCGGPARV